MDKQVIRAAEVLSNVHEWRPWARWACTLSRGQGNIHPWYGPCDGLGKEGGCSECQIIAERVLEAVGRLSKNPDISDKGQG